MVDKLIASALAAEYGVWTPPLALGLPIKASARSVAADSLEVMRDLSVRGQRDTESPTPNGADPIAVAFLSTILKAGADGATAEDMVKALQVDHSKGIGGRSVRVNNLLLKCRFTPDEVYTAPKTAEGRIWRAGPKITEALEAIKREGST